MRRAEPLQASIASYLLPQLLTGTLSLPFLFYFYSHLFPLDFFTVDQSMSLLLQEFVCVRRHRTPSYDFFCFPQTLLLHCCC